MRQDNEAILCAIDERVEGMIDACTRCGKCVQVCPMPEVADIPITEPGAVANGVIGLLRGEDHAPARQWAQSCTGSGHCIEACDEGVNMRFLLAMTRRAIAHREREMSTRRREGREQFQKMSRGVRVLSRLQLTPALLERLSPRSHPERAQPPEVIFYTGCNLLKTPHIGLLCLDVLDALDVHYEVYGGPAHCCGILQMRAGDDENAMRQGERTIARFEAVGASGVVAWCPTCQMQFTETALPARAAMSDGGFDMTMFPVFLAARLDALRPLLTHRVSRGG